ncbi:hypothetical protein [Tautonia plasticadhaerens]|uniref:hypothetical protein n=1 Tax=Tautonia plasticadhaerens TaxID=2527974 RepID=UPI0011A276AF|nr:hypothetical protein [Tautonia plasticadhaerens]
MHPVADLELGLAQELAVGFGGERMGDPAQLGIAGRPQGLVDALGFGGLLGGQFGERHAGASMGK